MSSGDDAEHGGESFLARWSRRKLTPEQPAESPSASGSPNAGQGPGAIPAAEPGSAAAAPELPALETLDGLKSEYRAFMQLEVGEATRRKALQKLFSDPHFNIMDGLDTYIDDYSIEDPIPEAMLRGLNQARDLMLFADEAETQTAADNPSPPGAAAPVAKAAPEARIEDSADEVSCQTGHDETLQRPTPE